MKFFAVLLFLFQAVPSFAADPCMARQRSAARQAMADETGIDVRSIRVVSVDEGYWSENVANNSGQDVITVRGKGVERRYQVSARQIQASADCKITDVLRVD